MRNWKRFGLVSLFLAIIVMAGGYVGWKYYPAKFHAQALLQVSAQEPYVQFQAGETEVGADYHRYQLTQTTLVKSHLVLNAALQDRSVSAYRMIREQADPIAWLQGNLEVGFVGGSEVMRIALNGKNPDEVAGVVNAVKKAYLDEVVNVDVRRKAERHGILKKHRERYTELLNERRQWLHDLAEKIPSDDGLAAVEREKAGLLVSNTLWSERLKLRLEQAEAETLLARRKEVAGSATDAVRKEIAELEDRLAVVMARQKVLDRELEEVTRNSSIRPQVVRAKRDLAGMRTEIASFEESARMISAEIERLNIELSAPSRARTIEEAVPRKTRG